MPKMNWKWNVRDPKFKHFLEEHAPSSPLVCQFATQFPLDVLSIVLGPTTPDQKTKRTTLRKSTPLHPPPAAVSGLALTAYLAPEQSIQDHKTNIEIVL